MVSNGSSVSMDSSSGNASMKIAKIEDKKVNVMNGYKISFLLENE